MDARRRPSAAHFGDLEIVVVAIVAGGAAKQRLHRHHEPILAEAPFNVVSIEPAEVAAAGAHCAQVIPLRQIAKANGMGAPDPVGRVRRSPGRHAVVSVLMGSARPVVAAA